MTGAKLMFCCREVGDEVNSLSMTHQSVFRRCSIVFGWAASILYHLRMQPVLQNAI